jgi:Spy/CpxP family protein refolding chaperone
VLVIIVLPDVGVLAYLIVRGHTMHEHQEQDRAQYAAFRRIVQSPQSGSHADDVSQLAELRDRGVLTGDEFDRAKAKVLN